MPLRRALLVLSLTVGLVALAPATARAAHDGT